MVLQTSVLLLPSLCEGLARPSLPSWAVNLGVTGFRFLNGTRCVSGTGLYCQYCLTTEAPCALQPRLPRYWGMCGLGDLRRIRV